MPDSMEESSLLAGLATAVLSLSRQERPAGRVYEDTVLRAYNYLVLRTLAEDDYPTPSCVPEMIELMADRPVHAWLPGSTSDTVLVHADTRTPTQACVELALDTTRDPFGEQHENDILIKALTACRHADSPESYVAFRRLLITRPVLTDHELATQRAELDLLPVADLLDRSYGRVAPRWQRDGEYAECARCHCLLRPISTDRWQCDLDRCRASTVTVGRTLDAATPGGIRQLTLPLRTSITGPGLFEVDLETSLLQRGLAVEMWPGFDAYDLLVTFPDGARWAIDVKDHASPGLLGRTFAGLPSEPPHDRVFLVVPDYRRRTNPQYATVYGYARQTTGRNPRALPVTFMKNFLRAVDRKLSATTTSEGTRA